MARAELARSDLARSEPPRAELARFLRDRRGRLRPGDLGLPADGVPRRTPGLRREEIAELAYISVDYYARLEQARGPRPSPGVLDALADVLRLDAAERSHLFRLAGTPAAPRSRLVRRVRPYVVEMLHRIPETAAIVTDAGYDVIAWNPLAQALFGYDHGSRPNLARQRFLADEGGRDAGGGGSDLAKRFPRETAGSEEFGVIAVSRLRRAATNYPRDERLTRLLADLRSGSEEFAEIWDTNPVHAPGHRTKTLHHPRAGDLRLSCDILTVPEDDQQVVFVTAAPGSRSARALRRLAATR